MLWVTLIYRAFIIPLCFQETMNHGHTLGLFKNFYSFTWQLTCIHTRNLQRSPSRSFLSRRHQGETVVRIGRSFVDSLTQTDAGCRHSTKPRRRSRLWIETFVIFM